MVKTKKAVFSDLRLFLAPAILVSAFGYFVDVFDLILFSIVRVRSLTDLGLSGDALTQSGVLLINMQMGGMLLGGILWGVFGDKKGRLKVLFGSILLYSIGNLANAFVHSVDAYAFWRFVTGLGLAGEIGAGITLVAEGMPKAKRGLATTVIATVGVSGAIAAAIVTDFVSWRTAYIIGGVMGLCLLVARALVYESKLFEKMDVENIARGKFFAFFTDTMRFKNYLCCILSGVPVWFFIGILATLAPELLTTMGVKDTVNMSYIIIAAYSGVTAGDLFSGLLSQFLQSRLRALGVMLFGAAASIVLFYALAPMSIAMCYAFYFIIGFFCGLWVLIVTIAAETFGTNLRNTAASSVPNFIRGCLVPLNLLILQLRQIDMDLVTASQIVGAGVFVLAFLSVWLLPETYHRDLDFNESLKSRSERRIRVFKPKIRRGD